MKPDDGVPAPAEPSELDDVKEYEHEFEEEAEGPGEGASRNLSPQSALQSSIRICAGLRLTVWPRC